MRKNVQNSLPLLKVTVVHGGVVLGGTPKDIVELLEMAKAQVERFDGEEDGLFDRLNGWIQKVKEVTL